MSDEEIVETHINIRIPDSNEGKWWAYNFEININDGCDTITNIGKGKGHILLNPYDCDEFVEISDEISQECYDLCVALDNGFFDDISSNRIVTIESVEIYQNYRRQGIGLKIMNSLLNFFAGDFILMLPHPIKGTCPEEKIKNATEKLQKYWMKCGFRRLGDKEVFYFN